MADLARLEQALKDADAAGDTASAQALADEIRRLQSEESQPGAMARFSSGFNQGVARTAGAPVDIINSLMGLAGLDHPEPLGGSKSIQRGMAKVGMTGPVDEQIELGRAGRIGEISGAAAVAGPGIVAGGIRSLLSGRLPVAPGAKPGSVGPSVRQETGTARGIVEDVAQTAVSKPGRFVGAEAAASVGAGVASYEATQQFPDSEGAQAMAEIVGGFTPAGAIMATKGATRAAVTGFEHLPLLGPMIARNARKLVSGLTLQGGRRRAQDRIKRAVEDPAVTAERLKRTDVIPDAPLTPAQKSGEGNLLALERSVMESTPELSLRRQSQLSDVNRTIRGAMEAPVREIPTHKVKEYLQGLLDTRLHIAAAKADERITALGTSATREDINRIAREELLSARTAARAQESQLHQAIPQTARAPTTAAQDTYENFRLTLATAQRGDIPAVARRLLDPKSKNFLGDETTINEIRGLQSALREQSRIARSDGHLNKARIADDIADSLTEDISNAVGGPEVRESVDTAVAFSRDFHDRFTRGAVGKLLGTERSGAAAVPEGLTLEVTVGTRGPRAREATDALLEAVRRSGDEEAMRGHIEAFLMDDFRRAAVKGGHVDVKAAERYLRENQDVLARFPETRRAMDGASRAGADLADVERLADPRVSRTAVFLNAPPGQEIQRVIATSRPRQAMDELVVMARNDPTGQAEKGLKAAFQDFLLKRSEMSGSLDVDDLPFVSGARLSRELDDPQILEAMQGLFSRAEIKRIEQIRQTALLLDRARSAPKASEGVIGDMPGQVTSTLARMTGAQVGRIAARHTGGGTVQTPGIMASQVQRLLRAGIQDPARRLLNDAIQDEQLFKTLLLPTDTAARQQAVKTRLNAWVVEVLREQYEYDEDEE